VIGKLTFAERASIAFAIEDQLRAMAPHPMDAVIIGALVLADIMTAVTKTQQEALSLIPDATQALRDRIKQGHA
jgi:hypothetical protein